MKAGDMVLQSEFVARWARDKKLAFIGDGDAISVCVAYLKAREIIDYGPAEIVVFDFDERICNAVERFADRERIEGLRHSFTIASTHFRHPLHLIVSTRILLGARATAARAFACSCSVGWKRLAMAVRVWS